MNRTPLIAGNWKMNTDVTEARRLAGQIRERIADLAGVEVALCPPAISLSAVAEVTAGSDIAVGAQNCHFEDSGAFTGEISPAMLVGLCKYTILGHSERRQYFAETNEFVGQKLRGALRHDLTAILCVGETLAERDQGITTQVIGAQLAGALSDLREPSVVVAYEPVWAIGTGLPATGSHGERGRRFHSRAAGSVRLAGMGRICSHTIRRQRKRRELRRVHRSTGCRRRPGRRREHQG